MEDDELRKVALELSNARNQFFRHDLPPQMIVEVAETFYQFLIGETK